MKNEKWKMKNAKWEDSRSPTFCIFHSPFLIFHFFPFETREHLRSTPRIALLPVGLLA